MTAGLEILNLHAQGGMAEVYRARATDEHGRSWHYAVKRMLPELLKEAEMMRMFIEEQRVAACLVHDNIVRVYDVAQADGAGAADTFIVMEFLEGRDLSEVIEAASHKKKPLPVWFCIHVAREVLKALHYATTQAKDKSGRVLGLIHRDISPHNIFVCRDGQVKLTDFGVAKVETAEVRTKAGIIKGKFGYMSPEQLMAGQLDFRSDLYNVGILLYESLTGKRLFWGETATQFIASMMQNEIPPLAKSLLVPPELDQLMRRALAKKREERPQSALVFDGQLAQIADKYGLTAQRGHIALEMEALFPELAHLSEPTADRSFEAPAHTQPEPATLPPEPPAPAPVPSSHAAPRTAPQQQQPMVRGNPSSLSVAAANLDDVVSAAAAPRQATQKPQRVPTQAKRLTFVSQAPGASGSEEQQAVFTATRDRADINEALGRGPTATAAPMPAARRPEDDDTDIKEPPQPRPGRQPRPSSGAAPVPPRPSMASVPAMAAPSPPRAPAPSIDPADDDLVPTLMEARPSFEELGLEPAAVNPPSSEALQTEPSRQPAFLADHPSSTAPSGRESFRPAADQRPVFADDDLELANATTAETMQRPAFPREPPPPPPQQQPAPPPPMTPQPAPTPRPHRVSTGSRRVISLADDEKPRKK